LTACIFLPKHRVNSQFVHFVNENHNVMTENFTKRLVDHRRIRPAAERVSEFPFDHAKSGLHVGTFVVVRQKRLTLEHEEVKQLLPQTAFAAAVINAERDKRNASSRDYGFKVLDAAIRFVAGYFADFEILRRSFHQRSHKGAVVCFYGLQFQWL